MRPLVPLLLAGCAASERPCAVSVEDGAVPILSWTTDEAVEAWVAYRREGGEAVQTAAATATAHRHALVGLPAESAAAWEAHLAWPEGEQVCTGETETPPLPEGLPPVEVLRGEGADPRPVLAAVFSVAPFSSWLVVYDRDGVVRWFHEGDEDRIVIDVQPAADGRGLLHNQFDRSYTEDVGLIRRLDWDGSTLDEVHTPLAHHTFAQLPDGGLAFQQLDLRAWTDPDSGETSTLIGDAVAEIDADGEAHTVFSVWDWLEVEPNPWMDLPTIYPEGRDWTHGNALKHDAEADRYLLSLGNANVLVDIDRQSGAPTAMYGAVGVPVADGGPTMQHQHDPTWLDDHTLLLFDTHFETGESGAFEYTLEDGELHFAWQYVPEDQLTWFLGQATRLDDGATLVNFGAGKVIDEVERDGSLRWRATLPAEFAFAQVALLDDFPLP